MVVLGVAAVAFVAGRGSDDVPSVALPAPVDGVIEVPGFAPRRSPAITSVDGALFLFGGYSMKPGPKDLLNDGVLVAADFTSAARLPDAPFDRPLYNPKAAAVDGRVLAVGPLCRVVSQDEDAEDPVCDPGTYAAAVLDVRDGRAEWRLTGAGSWAHSEPTEGLVSFSDAPDLMCLDDTAAVIDPPSMTPMGLYSLGEAAWSAPVPPPKEYYAARVWTGSELVFLPVAADFGGRGTSFNPSTRAWTPPAGLPAVQHGAVWNGAAIVGYTEPGRSGPAATPLPAGVFRYVMKPA